MKAIKHDKAVALLACGFMFAATAGLVVSGLNKSEEIAQTAGVESFKAPQVTGYHWIPGFPVTASYIG